MNEEINIKVMIDKLADNANIALEEYMKLNQEQVDKIVKAMALAGLEHHRELAKLAYEETKRGVYEDKVIKNLFSTEYIWHSIKYQKTCRNYRRKRIRRLCRSCRTYRNSCRGNTSYKSNINNNV